jgi:arsenical pump membrane protein
MAIAGGAPGYADMLRFAIGTAIFVAALAAIMIRPYRVPEAVTALIAGSLIVVCGFVTPTAALDTLVAQWNLYGFFLGLMVISALADQAGIFDMLAAIAGRWAGGKAQRLLLAVFLVGMLITAFLSNDATALILTPIVYALVTRLRLPPLPFMFACTFIADTSSFLLPVSNPINVLVLDAFGGGLAEFWRYLLLPSVVCITLNIAVFAVLFRRELRLDYDVEALAPTAAGAGGVRYRRATLVGLGLIATGYLVVSALALPLSIVALGGGALLLAITAACGRLNLRRLAGEISWPLFGFISGMFVLVRGVEDLGLSALIGGGLLHLGGSDPLQAVLAASAGTALGANTINNLPMALVMVSALRSLGAAGAHQPLIYATIFGADLGPNLTTVGSLATMLWLLILRRKGLEVSSIQYMKLGLAIVPAMIVLGSLLIWLGL